MSQTRALKTSACTVCHAILCISNSSPSMPAFIFDNDDQQDTIKSSGPDVFIIGTSLAECNHDTTQVTRNRLLRLLVAKGLAKYWQCATILVRQQPQAGRYYHLKG